MHRQSIYEDFCFEVSFLGNREKTCMDELSFISALASCEQLNSKNFDISSSLKKALQRDVCCGGTLKTVWG